MKRACKISMSALVFLTLVTGLFAELTFQINYVNATPAVQEAFEYAAAVWSEVLDSPVPVKINVIMNDLPGLIILPIPNTHLNPANAPVPNVWYPSALANALAEEELNPGEADMDFYIVPSPSGGWYIGLDGNCPTNEVDLVTSIVSGLSYGFGYISTFMINTENGNGLYGMFDPALLGVPTSFTWNAMNGIPAIYETFVMDGQGHYLTDTAHYANNSAALTGALMGGSLSYGGEFGIEYCMGDNPVLYAGAFSIASTARLSSAVYWGTENESGVPTQRNGDVNHQPSPIVMGMLKDFGWSVDPTPLMLVPTGLTGELNQDGEIALTWEAPDTYYDIHGYNVYRGETLVATITETEFIDADIDPGSYEYQVNAIYSMGVSPLTEPVTVEVVGTDPQDITPFTGKTSVYPNPFNPTTTISLDLPLAGPVTVRVYNLRGQLVQTLFDGSLTPGTHRFEWHGNDNNANNMASGLYFYRVDTQNGSTVGRMTLLK